MNLIEANTIPVLVLLPYLPIVFLLEHNENKKNDPNQCLAEM